MVLLSISFENMHQILRNLYDTMTKLCHPMMDMAMALAALGALFYIAYRVWQSLSGHHRLSHHVRTELVLLLLVLLQVEGLVTEQHSGSLNDGAKDTVESSQHHHVKEKDTHAQDKRP